MLCLYENIYTNHTKKIVTNSTIEHFAQLSPALFAQNSGKEPFGNVIMINELGERRSICERSV